jgi:hypothetical protein
MVIGLAPVFLFWNKPMPRISFQLSVWTGIGAGILLASGQTPPLLSGLKANMVISIRQSMGYRFMFCRLLLTLAFPKETPHINQ